MVTFLKDTPSQTTYEVINVSQNKDTKVIDQL